MPSYPRTLAPFYLDVARGPDAHLVYTYAGQRPQVLSHGNSQARVMGVGVISLGHEAQRSQIRIEQSCDAYVVPLPTAERVRLRECLLRYV